MKGVFLLHGFLTSPKDCVPLVCDLKKIYDKVYCPLYPGHGTRKVRFRAEDLFALVESEFKKFTAECDVVDVIGFSMGGAIATYLASKYEFRNLVLMAPANKYYNFAFLPMTAVYYTKMFFRGLRYRRLAKKDGDYSLVDKVKSDIKELNKNKRISIYMAATQVVPNWTPSNIKNFRYIAKTCNKAIADAGSINKPTVILWGHLDQLVSIKSPKFLYDKVSSDKKSMFIFDDMTHLMLYSNDPSELINAIISFLKRNDC